MNKIIVLILLFFFLGCTASRLSIEEQRRIIWEKEHYPFHDTECVIDEDKGYK